MSIQELRKYVFNRFGAACLFCGWDTDADALVVCKLLLGAGRWSDYFPVCPSCLERTKSSTYFEAPVQPDG
jgi:hypothetical protein